MPTRLCLNGVSKNFVMHLQGGAVLPVVAEVELAVAAGECVVLGGRSGIGKSSVLKMIYGNYRCEEGQILITDGDRIVNVATASPREILALRKETIGYVSQFLRAIPRVSARDIVAEPLIERGVERDDAVSRAEDMLARLNVPEKLWGLPPATFSGGEQQRVNIARGFIADFPILLLDEPTASLDAANRAVVVDLVKEKKASGAALLGILHDADVRERIADRVIDMEAFAAEKAA
ncbi:alpha-D-ribose 1-methylphosphonate 5-triphosphate synthase subunit PhnL [Rhodobium orientis]|uniref:Phosphonate C-P lyase system protein PhnL n=1 Tax=Rhodobium orientis TaxID=34017 RepID=A0A327JL11_9HYPH|nr:phosphonate C-P lyase system protein PhnL [Rhodobium orientis]MBB4303611.1 alpha-D-ribose 1-methylphosphonate 5-triphosphate synthase subunit PhnL [Rhodobium orientis]MBK5951933.1 phosphonate C-P lyase system protein PhnL [Rhodobium orientis]RAI26781.1 phosphonate C-P lyase system protein PhnL [Rhodobium orientis]